jgi:hypothetical protein
MFDHSHRILVWIAPEPDLYDAQSPIWPQCLRRGRGPPPFVTGLGSPGRGVSLGKYAMPQQVGEPQDPDPSVSFTFVAHNWFYRTTRSRRGSRFRPSGIMSPTLQFGTAVCSTSA